MELNKQNEVNALQDIMALKLLQLRAIKFQPLNPFVWANRWYAPMYCDDRKVLSYPKMRDFVRLELARTIAEKYPDVDVVAGVATNAIAHGVLVAEQLGLPFIYVHPAPKDHGLENQIEGDLRPRQSVVIIENQVIVGDNCLKVIDAIRNNGCKVVGIITIFDYGFATTRRKFEKAGVELTSLTNFPTILRLAEEMDIISKDQQKAIQTWQRHPSKWEK